MAVRVRKFINFELGKCEIQTDTFHVANDIRVTPNGDLEVLERETVGDKALVQKAYAAGRWIDAEVAVRTRDGRLIWKEE